MHTQARVRDQVPVPIRLRRASRWARWTTTLIMIAGAAMLFTVRSNPIRADTIPLALTDPSLQATTVLAGGISQPIGIVFLGATDYLVLERASGQIKRVIGGGLQPTHAP